MSQKDPPRALQYLVLGAGILAISSGSILIRLAQNEAVPSLVIALWRMLLSTLILLPFAIAGRRYELREMGKAKWGLAILSGMLLGAHFATWTQSIALTSITSSTVLVATAPLWVGLASPFLLNEPLARGLKIGIGLALLGTIVVSLGSAFGMENGRIYLDLSSSSGGSNPLIGNALALIGGITVAGYLIIGRRLRPHLSLLSYTFVVYGMAAMTLLVFNLIAGQYLIGYGWMAFILFLLMALFPQLTGHSSFNWALSFLPAAFVSLAAISEPVGATILAMFVFQEFPGPVVILGSVLILAGVYIGSRSQA
ncbi:MAG: DMT family transporter [Candidatus Promineifilaceae bacterium]|nr:DMT family transporter [Candidatus Promineifilaceae bacterium]